MFTFFFDSSVHVPSFSVNGLSLDLEEGCRGLCNALSGHTPQKEMKVQPDRNTSYMIPVEPAVLLGLQQGTYGCGVNLHQLKRLLLSCQHIEQ